MPYRDADAKRLYDKLYRRRKRGHKGIVKGVVPEMSYPRKDKRNVVPKGDMIVPFPVIRFELKAVQVLLDYLGLTQEELEAGTAIAHVRQVGYNQLVFKPRTGEILGILPESNARGLTAVWDYIAKHEADIALLQAQQTALCDAVPTIQPSGS